MIELDGSLYEGGGQMLRTALTLSALSGKAFRIFNIRAGRDPKGLRRQHFTVLSAMRKICRARVSGMELGSTEVEFIPTTIAPGRYRFDIMSAGSITLLLQALLPPLLIATKKSSLEVIGGTDVPFSPTYDYFEQVFLRFLTLCGGEVASQRISGGYYPKGGGKVRVNISPSNIHFPSIIPSEEEVRGIIRLAGLPKHIAYREKKPFVERGWEAISIREEDGGPGNSLTAWKGFIGASSVGVKGKRAEEVSKEVIEVLEEDSSYDVDRFLGDQIMLIALFGGGTYKARTTKHVLSNAYIINSFFEGAVSVGEGRISVKDVLLS